MAEFQNLPPAAELLEVAPATDHDSAGAGIVAGPRGRSALVWARLRRTKRFWFGATVLLVMVIWAVLGPHLYQWSLDEQDAYNLDYPPTSLHWFGTDELGFDLYTAVMTGLRKSLIIGFVAGLLCTFLSAIIGSLAGYIGGITDKTVAWFTNLMLVLPTFFILIMLYPVTHGDWRILTVFLALTSWMVMAQTVRMQTMALREREFVRAARYMGFGTWSVVRRHIIPNVISLLIIDATLNIGGMILAESALSFFGFGVQPPDVSLGTLISSGWAAATTRSWLFYFPAGTLVVLLLAISLVGDALRDALDPTSGSNRG
ncbi:ABC transporter permease [Nocardioides montaniterrae]